MNVKRITPVMLTYAAQSEWIWRHYLAVSLVFFMILRRVLV